MHFPLPTFALGQLVGTLAVPDFNAETELAISRQPRCTCSFWGPVSISRKFFNRSGKCYDVFIWHITITATIKAAEQRENKTPSWAKINEN